jgi:hypothetical protein
MDKYFSYVDTIFRTINFNITSNLTKEGKDFFLNLFKKFKSANKQKADVMGHIIHEYLFKDPEFQQLFIHECNHYWQTFYYPYLYILSYFQYSTLIEIAGALREHEEDIFLDKYIEVNPSLNTSLVLASSSFKLIWENNKLKVKHEKITNVGERLFCLNDFIENATSIFQFQVIFNEDASYQKYEQWVKNPSNKVYKNLYIFLSHKLGAESAYKMIPPLVQIIFQTTEPLSFFCALINCFIEKKDFNWDYEILKAALLQYQNPDIEFNMNQYNSISDLPQAGYISQNQYNQIIKSTKEYPLSAIAEYYLSLCNGKQLQETLLINANSKNLDILLKEFPPHSITYNFTDFQGEYRPVAIFSHVYEHIYHSLPKNQKNPVLQNIFELAKSLDIVQVLILKNFSLIPHNCRLTNCKYHSTFLCRRWFSTPRKIEDCPFPEYLTLNFYKQLNFENMSLTHVSQNQEDIYKIKFVDKSVNYETKNRVNYYFIENYIILEVPEKNINKLDTNYFIDFLASLREKENLLPIDLENKIFIQFRGYDQDPREIYEIPEVVLWFKQLRKKLPYLFYYLNIDVIIENKILYLQPTIIIPVFVGYTVEDKGVSINLDDFRQVFIQESVTALINFCESFDLDVEKIVSRYGERVKQILITLIKL